MKKTETETKGRYRAAREAKNTEWGFGGGKPKCHNFVQFLVEIYIGASDQDNESWSRP